MTDASTPGPATAVVLVNLGTPDAPTPAAVRRYLSEFLHDRRVVDMTRWLWCPLLHFVILPRRSGPVARKYASIWMSGEDGGSPLAVHTRRLAGAVADRLPGTQVIDAMRYGQPSLAGVLRRLRGEGVERMLVLPLYPQYSSSTSAAVADVVAREAPDAWVVRDYHDDPDWVAAVAGSIRDHRAARGAGEHLVFSFHGLPQRFIDRGDPYQGQCEVGARLVVAALGLEDDEWSLCYQSRFGRERWLQPSTADTLAALADQGVRRVDVVAPGFAVDCLETLEEVSMLLAEDFAGRGGSLRYIPCLNDRPAHARVLAAIARRELDHWR